MATATRYSQGFHLAMPRRDQVLAACAISHSEAKLHEIRTFYDQARLVLHFLPRWTRYVSHLMNLLPT